MSSQESHSILSKRSYRSCKRWYWEYWEYVYIDDFFFFKNFILTTCHQFLPKVIQREIIIWQVTFENVYLLCSQCNRFVQPCLYRMEMLLRCAMFISHEPLIWRKIDLFLTVLSYNEIIGKISVTCIKIIMEFCWILFSQSRMMYMNMWLCFCMFHQPKVTYLLKTKNILKILLITLLKTIGFFFRF